MQKHGYIIREAAEEELTSRKDKIFTKYTVLENHSIKTSASYYSPMLFKKKKKTPRAES